MWRHGRGLLQRLVRSSASNDPCHGCYATCIKTREVAAAAAAAAAAAKLPLAPLGAASRQAVVRGSSHPSHAAACHVSEGETCRGGLGAEGPGSAGATTAAIAKAAASSASTATSGSSSSSSAATILGTAAARLAPLPLASTPPGTVGGAPLSAASWQGWDLSGGHGSQWERKSSWLRESPTQQVEASRNLPRIASPIPTSSMPSRFHLGCVTHPHNPYLSSHLSDYHHHLPSTPLPLLPCIHFSAPAIRQQGRIRVFVQSPGMVAEPYRPPPPPLPFFQRFFTRAGWDRFRCYIMDSLKTGYSIAMLRKNTKGYSQKGFYSHVSSLYSQVNKAIAADDRTTLRQLVTEAAYTTMKSQLKQRSEKSKVEVKWELAGPIKNLRTLQARLVGMEQKRPDNSFIQVTVQIKSQQKFGVFDSKGRPVAGDFSKEIDVEDIWVVERHLLHPNMPWRLCGRITLPPESP